MPEKKEGMNVPIDTSAEKTVLTAMSSGMEKAAELCGSLAAEDFYRPRNALMFNYMKDTALSGGRFDATELKAALMEHGCSGVDASLEVIDLLGRKQPDAAELELAIVALRRCAATRLLARASAMTVGALSEGPKNLDDSIAFLEKCLEAAKKHVDGVFEDGER